MLYCGRCNVGCEFDGAVGKAGRAGYDEEAKSGGRRMYFQVYSYCYKLKEYFNVRGLGMYMDGRETEFMSIDSCQVQM